MKKHKIDKAQKVLVPKTMAETGLGIVTTQTATVSLHEQVFCPFCLHIGKVQDFIVSTKKGVDSRSGKCPECKQGMLLRTLTREFTPEQFAEWIYNDYGKWFWRKVSFGLFTKRLHDIGWSYRFWRRYKELKGETGQESYDEYIARRQEEQRAEMVDEHG